MRLAEPAARACVDGALAWLMNGLLNSGAAAVGPLVRALRQCAAVLCKLQLMAGPAFTSGAVVSVCDATPPPDVVESEEEEVPSSSDEESVAESSDADSVKERKAAAACSRSPTPTFP